MEGYRLIQRNINCYNVLVTCNYLNYGIIMINWGIWYKGPAFLPKKYFT